MALDATPAGASADSYLTVAEADALAGADLGPEVDAWVAATTTAKEKALKRATREIDGHLRTTWKPYANAQRLRFPRYIDRDSAGDPVIPADIVRATYQQAIFVLRNAVAIAAANARGARNKTQASEPNHSYTAGDPGDPNLMMSTLAIHYLSGFAPAPRARAGAVVRSARVSTGFRSGR